MTEPESSLRVSLDLGTPIQQALQALFTPLPRQPEQIHHTLTAFYPFVTRLLAAFKSEEQQEQESALANQLPEPPLVAPGKRSSALAATVVSLTRREQEVLCLLAKGASNREIATALVIQLSTVKKHVSNLLEKLGAASRTQAIVRARALSLL